MNRITYALGYSLFCNSPVDPSFGSGAPRPIFSKRFEFLRGMYALDVLRAPPYLSSGNISNIFTGLSVNLALRLVMLVFTNFEATEVLK